jgi:hypothetical protein
MKRLLGSRGATGADYALVLTLVVVTSIGAINFLTDRASDETQNQADCVQTRPPVDGCQLPPLIPTTTTTLAPPGPPPPPGPPGPPTPPDPCDTDPSPASCFEPPPPPPLPPPPPANEADWAGPPVSAINPSTGAWEITATMTVLDSTGVPVAGARVVFALQIYNPNPPPVYLPTIFVECVTDATGNCSITAPVPYSNATEAKLSVYQIISNPATNPPGTEYDGIIRP